MEGQFVNCLICNDYFEGKPLSSLVSYPRILRRGHLAENEQLFSKWKAAFQLFSRLLVADTGFDCGVKRFQLVFEKWATQRMRFQSPCCSSCSPVLFEIAKIQVTIDESMKRQRERVDQLKHKLISNPVVNQDPLADDNDTRKMVFEWDNSIKEADHALEPELSVPAKVDFAVAVSFHSKSSNAPVVEPKPRSKKRKFPPGKRQTEVFAQQTETVKAKRMKENLEMKPCVVLLERLVPEVNEGAPVPSTSRVRKSKLKAVEVIRKSCLSSGTGASLENKEEEDEEVPPKRLKQPNKIKNEFEDSEDDEWMAHQHDDRDESDGDVSESKVDNDDDGDDDNHKVEPKSNGRRKTGKTVVPRRRLARSDLFFLLQEKFLLYKITIIEVYLRQKLICKEASCTFEVDGIDSVAFDKIRKHVTNSHLTERNYSKKTRPCPICKKGFFATTLKVHLLEDHQPVTTVCEICWKPLKALLMPAHMFLHKNAEERRDVMEEVSNSKSKKLPGYIRKLGGDLRSKLRPNQQKAKILHNLNMAKRPNATREREAGTGEKEKKVLGIHLSKESVSGTRRVARSDLFFLVDEKFLLYKNTIVEVYLRQKMICTESNCTFEAGGIDSFAFAQIREHITNSHLTEDNYSKKNRPCPVCQKYFCGGTLKVHLFQDHQPVNTVCEICWKPLKSLLTSAHTFLHKNAEERKAAMSVKKGTASKDNRALPGDILKLGGNLEPRTKPRQPTSTKKKIMEREGMKKTRKRKSEHMCWFHVVDKGHLLYAKRSLVKVIHCQKLQCEECNFIVEGTSEASLQEMRKHLEMLHLNKSNSCPEQLQPCPFCPKSYLGTILENHFTGHHQVPLDTLICEICWRPLGAQSDPRFHMWLHKSEEEKKLAISAGGKDFGKNHQDRQKYMDSLLPSLPCSTCGKTFKTQYFLKVHEITHLPRDLRPLFQCEYCPEKMLSERALRFHIERSHRPDLAMRSKVCRFCDKKFHYNDGNRYQAHLRSHTNEKPYVCDTCGMSFTTKDRLTKHLTRVHSTERPYQCEFCEMTYRHPMNLTRHQRTRHKDKMTKESDPENVRKYTSWQHSKDFIGPKIAYPCEFCGKVFELRSRMTKHVKERHYVKQDEQS